MATIDDVQEAAAFNIDSEHYMELSAKPFLELEEKLELKKYNLAAHYGVEPNEITPKFVKTFDREKPRSVWDNTVKALPSDMKIYDGVVNWCTRNSEYHRPQASKSKYNCVLTCNGWP